MEADDHAYWNLTRWSKLSTISSDGTKGVLMGSSEMTTAHQIIQEWVKARGGRLSAIRMKAMSCVLRSTCISGGRLEGSWLRQIFPISTRRGPPSSTAAQRSLTEGFAVDFHQASVRALMVSSEPLCNGKEGRCAICAASS